MTEVGDGPIEVIADRDRPHGNSDDRDRVVRLLKGLTEKERRVVVLRHYFDLSEARVAEELGIARGTVKSTLSRALSKLRVAVDDLQHSHPLS
ncbi:sigma-70 family RNA polymerase sigma factor [Nocardioides sp. B-3]|nr:sigma-70 family RNA polymerase sigma factor [Nocardioides sp. B-3]UUZ61852.1 sigma-70 family RNA polymerase sigma factor [Nocardioides sp. B-3]